MKARSILAGATFAIALCAQSAWAQYGTVRGKVVDDQGKPIPEAEIVLELQGGDMQKKATVKSGKKGDFTQVGLPRGVYKVTVTKEGFAPLVGREQVQTGDTTEMGDVKLTPMAKAQAQAQAAGAAKNPTQAELNAAVQLANDKKFDEAETAFKAFITKNPAHAMAHHNLGWVYSQKQDWANAEVEFKKSIELEPNAPDSYGALINVYQKAGKPAEAAEFLTKAAAAQPDNGMVQYNLAVTYINAQKNAEAYAALEKAAAAMPDNAEVQYLMGTTALNLNNIPDTIKHLEKYLSMSPSNEVNVKNAKDLIAALKPAAK